MRSRARGRGVDDDDDDANHARAWVSYLALSTMDGCGRRGGGWGCARARRTRIRMCAEIFCVMRCARDRASRACVATSVRAEARAVAMRGALGGGRYLPSRMMMMGGRSRVAGRVCGV